MIYALLACTFGAYAAFLLQHEGWTYQFRPAIAFSEFILFYLLFEFSVRPYIG